MNRAHRARADAGGEPGGRCTRAPRACEGWPWTRRRGAVLVALACLLAARAASGQAVLDLAALSTDSGGLLRATGSAGDGRFGVPVAGGYDVDGDTLQDFAFSAMRASPFGRSGAGEIYLLFGDGRVAGLRDTAVTQPDLLVFAGAAASEAAGSEIWIDDVTGDGLGDLLIARQNFSLDGARVGAGALSIVPGGPALRASAQTLLPIDLAAAPSSLGTTTLVGPLSLGRLGIWVRTGDVTGDGVSDLLVGADQVSRRGETHRGEAYLVRGGDHLLGAGTIDLAAFGATGLSGHVARIAPPPDSPEAHFGATVQIADLDGDGRGEVLVAAALNRAGAAIAPLGAPSGATHARGGTGNGTLYIVWSDRFAGAWEPGLEVEVGAEPAAESAIAGASCHRSFGEEVLGGLDYDGDGEADLFVGDLAANCSVQFRPQAGAGVVLFGAASLRGLSFDLDAPPAELGITHFLGAQADDLAGDTAVHGDFDGDGRAELAFSAPQASPLQRESAGEIYVLFGADGPWPARIDLDALAEIESVRSLRIFGALGSLPEDEGDTLGYSAAAGDLDGDGTQELIVNEMTGNGTAPGTVDVGNLVAISLPEARGSWAAVLVLGVLARLRGRTGRRAQVAWHLPRR